MNGYALAAAALALLAGGFFWMHRMFPRLVSIAAAAAAFCLVAAVPAWRDALAGTFASGPGMIALTALVLLFTVSFALDHLRHHHPVRTTFLGIVGATALAMAWAMAPELGKQGSKIGPGTSAAMGTAMQQIRSGQAASAQPASTRAMILLMGALAVVVLITFMRRHHRKRPYRNARAFGHRPAIASGRPAIGGGPGGLKRKRGRRALLGR